MLIHTHIPKCVGTAFTRMLRVVYRSDFHLVPAATAREDAELPLVSQHQHRAVSLEVPFGCHNRFHGGQGVPFDQVQYVTILRDPCLRFISAYHYPLTITGHHLKQVMLDQKPTLWDYPFLVTPGENPKAKPRCNRMVRYLSGILTGGKDARSGFVTEKHLDDAIRNLERHYLFIFADNMMEGLFYLHDKLDWPRVPANVVVNKNRVGYSPPTQEMLDFAAEHNDLDMILWEHARRIYKQRIHAHAEAR